VVLLPIYLFFLQVNVPVVVTLVYTLIIAGLMVSRLPVLSGKKMGTRVPPEMVLPVIVVAVLAIALLVSYPWYLLTAGTLAYLVLLPLGFVSYQRQLQADAALVANAAATPPASDAVAPPLPVAQGDDDRPTRLN
jgi:CDP-diacylglycerol--serine O-phosphatidyltransferase